MPLPQSHTCYFLGVFALLLSALSVVGGASREFPARRFDFIYRFTVSPPPETKHLRIWIPLAVTSRFQEATLRKVEGPIEWHPSTDPIYGNRLLYGEVSHPRLEPLQVALYFAVTRKEAAALPRHEADVSRYLKPDRLVPLEARFQGMAREIAAGKSTTREKARALYDFVFGYMSYDKSGTGWGRGDAVYACDVRRGNCTDFHSLFMALARSINIPARFIIGFPLPAEDRAGTVEGYHCWAEFYMQEEGWVPVDITDAWKQPARKDYFFGTLDRNRVQFTQGRDLMLSPPQRGAPLNYFIYPYAEADGIPLSTLTYQFEYRDADGRS